MTMACMAGKLLGIDQGQDNRACDLEGWLHSHRFEGLALANSFPQTY